MQQQYISRITRLAGTNVDGKPVSGTFYGMTRSIDALTGKFAPFVAIFLDGGGVDLCRPFEIAPEPEREDAPLADQ